MANPTEPLRQGDLPDMKMPFWKIVGPGAIMVGMAVGSGELILWPWVTARFSAVMAWAPVVAVFLQIWLNLEIGRWAVATGESSLGSLARASKKIMYVYMGFLLVLATMPGWQRAAAAAIRFLVVGEKEPWLEGMGLPADSVWGRDWLWYIPITFCVWITLLGPKRIYSGVERTVTILVLVIFAGLLVVAVRIGTLQDVKDLATGVVNPTITLAGDFEFYRFFGAMVFAGAGGFGNLFYAYYLRDKGIGMGSRFPMLSVDIRGKTERADETGYSFPDTPENQQRFRAWFGFVKYDTWEVFGCVSLVTLFLFMFASLVALHPQPEGFGQGDVIWDLSRILGTTMGNYGRYLFLVIAIAALFSTILASTDGGIRMWTDLLHRGFPSTRRWSPGKMYVPLLFGLWPIGFTSMWYFETQQGLKTLDVFFISAAINGIAMAIYIPVILYLNLTHLPKSARPGVVNVFFMGCCTLVYGGFAVYLIWTKVGSWSSA